MPADTAMRCRAPVRLVVEMELALEPS